MKGISGLAIRLEDMKDLITRLEATEGIKGLIIGLETNKNTKKCGHQAIEGNLVMTIKKEAIENIIPLYPA